MPPIVREPLLTAALGAEAATVERVEVARIELPPGQETGLHLGPGDGFYEPAGTRISHFDNESSEEPAAFVAFYLLPPGEDRLIVMVE